MKIGTLSPRSADIVEEMRFSGAFGQPDGFNSILTVSVRKSGDVCLSLTYKIHDKEQFWAVELTNEQRFTLASLLARYIPTLFEQTVTLAE